MTCLYPQYLAKCLIHRGHSVNVCGNDEDEVIPQKHLKELGQPRAEGALPWKGLLMKRLTGSIAGMFSRFSVPDHKQDIPSVSSTKNLKTQEVRDLMVYRKSGLWSSEKDGFGMTQQFQTPIFPLPKLRKGHTVTTLCSWGRQEKGHQFFPSWIHSPCNSLFEK